MAQDKITPPHYTVPMVDKNGLVTQPWAIWLRMVWTRIGKEIALTNVQLEQRQLEELDTINATIAGIQSDIVGINSSITAIQGVNTTQNTRLSALEAQVQGILLEPVA